MKETSSKKTKIASGTQKVKTTAKTTVKRNAIRFLPDANTQVFVKSLSKLKSDKTYLGLVYSEAKKGFGAVFVNHKDLMQINDTFVVAVGELPPMKARLAWIEELDRDCFKAGFEYI